MRGARAKIAVVAWDLAHNAASCAYIMADLLRREHEVEIIGPTFLGSELWPPIRDADVPIQVFPGAPLPEFVHNAEHFVQSVEADVVLACKSRFPSLLLAMLIKDQCDAPVILHVDDLELGLVGASHGISLDVLAKRRGSPEFAQPGGALWAAACEDLIADADAITVSGHELSRRYGGVVVGQPRDETRFDPSLYDAGAIRAELGYSGDDRVVLFLGSPRRHKGIVELASAIADSHDPRLRLCVIGSFNDPRLRAEVAALGSGRIQMLGYQPISEVPQLLTLADLVCLPQDPAVGFVSYQTPMKLTEALAMGVPVLARETASLAPFARAGAIATIGDAPLGERIRSMFDDPGELDSLSRRGREFFLSHLSYDVALAKLNRVIARLPSDAGDVPAAWERACELASSAMSRS